MSYKVFLPIIIYIFFCHERGPLVMMNQNARPGVLSYKKRVRQGLEKFTIPLEYCTERRMWDRCTVGRTVDRAEAWKLTYSPLPHPTALTLAHHALKLGARLTGVREGERAPTAHG